MKNKSDNASLGVQELCRKLKLQLDELALNLGEKKSKAEAEDEARRLKLMEQLKQQLADLST